MNRFDSIPKPLMWFTTLLLIIFVAGCGGGDGTPTMNSAKAISAYSLGGVTGTITGTTSPFAIAVPLPYGSSTTQVATFTTTGASVAIGGVTQTSGTTSNSFTGPVAYIVTAADGSTATYNVTVTVAANFAKAISAYSLGGVAGTITGTVSPFDIAVTLPYGSSTTQVATFTTTGASVAIGGVTQTSGTTSNSFTGPVAYIVTAADGSTATYNVTVASATSVLPGVAGTTGANATNPTVISANPRNLGTNVPTSTNSWNWNGTTYVNVVSGTLVTATFNEAMTAGTITPVGTFTLKETTTGNNVPGTVTMNTANTIATFTPTATALTPNMSYTATVTTAATRVTGGTAMPKAVVWSFTTNATALTGQAPVNLKTAGDFAILAQTDITLNDTTTEVTGDVGISPGTASNITGASFTKTQDGSLDFWTSPEVVAVSGVTASGRIYASDDSGGGAGSVGTGITTAKVLQAKNDLIAAYADAAGRTAASGAFLNLNGGSLDAQTLVPGTYTWSGASANVTSSSASSVTLSGGPDDVWIFQIKGYFNPGANSNMILSNPTLGGPLPQAKNIFWAIAGSNVTPGAGAHMEGVILTGALGYITLNPGATANSRLLSQTAVTVNSGTVTQPDP